MNVISHDTAYSLYPRPTFETRRALVLPRRGTSPASALAKYVTRGWTLVAETDADADADIIAQESSFKSGARWIDDSTSWVLPLPTEGVVPLRDKVPDPVAHTNWQLGYSYRVSGDTYGLFPKVNYCLVYSLLLRHVYVLSDALLVKALWGALKGVHEGLEETKRELEDTGIYHDIQDLPL